MTITNPRARRCLYAVYSALSIALGSIFTFCGASSIYALPDWVQPASAALAYIGGAIGLVAGAHTPAGGAAERRSADPAQELDEADIPAA